MKWLVTFVGLALMAVMLALFVSNNVGMVSLFWHPWRLDISLNLFLLLSLLVMLALYVLMRTFDGLIQLPQKARAWRQLLAERRAQEQLRLAQLSYFAGRYSRAEKQAHKALELAALHPALQREAPMTLLAHLIQASSHQRLQNRQLRDEQMQKALQVKGDQDGWDAAHLMAAQWALDENQPTRAMELLSQLPAGSARRTLALRLRLQAARALGQPLEALKTARLLAKHGAFTPLAASSLMRSLAIEALDATRDADQLRKTWSQLETAERRNPQVGLRAAGLLVRWGDLSLALQWLVPVWDLYIQVTDDDRNTLCRLLIACTPELNHDWLQRIEDMLMKRPAEARLQFMAGWACTRSQLWGKAVQYLQACENSHMLPMDLQRHAWIALAQLHEHHPDPVWAQEKAAQLYKRAALGAI